MSHIDPEKIVEDFKNKKLDGDSTISSLIEVVERSKNEESRRKGTELLCIFKDNPLIFKFLENLLVSDTSPKIRGEAVKNIIKYFPNECKELIKWVIDHDNNVIVRNSILNGLNESNNILLVELKKDFLNKLSELFGICQDEVIAFSDIETILADSYHIETFDEKFYKNNLRNRYSFYKYMGESCNGYFELYTVWNKHVIGLNLTKYPLKELPDSFRAFKRLKKLILKDSEITKLPDWIDELSYLKHLDLMNSNLIRMPENISKLGMLKELRLTNNYFLESISDSLYELSIKNFSKKYINQGVQAEEAPVLGLLEIMSGFKLEKAINEEEYFLDGENKNLFKVNNDGNIFSIMIMHKPQFEGDRWDLGFIPTQIFNLKHLEDLNLSYNKIKMIPNSMCNLNKLKRLDLSSNNISEIPKCISKLKNLEFLALSNNEIKSIPESLKTCLNSLKYFKIKLPQTYSKEEALNILESNNYELIKSLVDRLSITKLFSKREIQELKNKLDLPYFLAKEEIINYCKKFSMNISNDIIEWDVRIKLSPQYLEEAIKNARRNGRKTIRFIDLSKA